VRYGAGEKRTVRTVHSPTTSFLTFSFAVAFTIHSHPFRTISIHLRALFLALSVYCSTKANGVARLYGSPWPVVPNGLERAPAGCGVTHAPPPVQLYQDSSTKQDYTSSGLIRIHTHGWFAEFSHMKLRNRTRARCLVVQCAQFQVRTQALTFNIVCVNFA
jgi:hypothetical protein